MDDKNQKERLEQELRFLKESFEAEVISKEEFEKGKGRIEKKLSEVKTSEKTNGNGAPKKETEAQEKTEEIEEDTKAKEKKIETKEEAVKQEAENTKQKQVAEESKTEAKEKNNLFKYSVVFIVFVLVAFFAYSVLKNNEEGERISEKTEALELSEEIQKVNVVVLNDRKNCFNCDTGRILSILEEWFGAISAREISYDTEDGKAIAEKFDASLLPMYALDENISQKESFGKFKSAFAKRNGSYVMREDAAGSTFYVKRDAIPNKLDFFVRENDAASIKAEENLKEFLDNFDDVDFEKHNSDDLLTKELGIKVFPTFLVNNKVKFSGVHSAESIKQNFCKMNDLPECGKRLSESLV